MIRMLERKMDQQIQELTTMVEKVRTLEAMVASLAASNRLDHGSTEFRGLGVIMASMACRYYSSCLEMGAGCTGRSRLV